VDEMPPRRAEPFAVNDPTVQFVSLDANMLIQWSTENSLCVDKPRTDHEQDEEVDSSIHLHGTPGWLAETFGSAPGARIFLLPTGNAHPDPGPACWPLIQAH